MSGQSKAQSFPAKFVVAKMVCAHNIPSLPPSSFTVPAKHGLC